LDRADSGYCVTDNAGGVWGPFDLILDASGRNSELMKYSETPPRIRPLKWGALWTTLRWPEDPTFAANTLSQRYQKAHTMIGVLPLGAMPQDSRSHLAFFWSLKVSEYDAWRRRGLKPWKTRVLDVWPETKVLLEQIGAEDQLELAQYSHHTMGRPYGPGVVFIGDAAHATSPQLGQGANMALLDVYAFANAMARYSGNLNAVARDYAARRRFHIRLFQALSLFLTPFYQSDNRLLALFRDTLFDPGSRIPFVSKLVAGMIAGTLGNPFKPRDD
ncbi:MAG: FAD-dependent monooxygenase, partial [Pseudomonadota bacterium]